MPLRFLNHDGATLLGWTFKIVVCTTESWQILPFAGRLCGRWCWINTVQTTHGIASSFALFDQQLYYYHYLIHLCIQIRIAIVWWVSIKICFKSSYLLPTRVHHLDFNPFQDCSLFHITQKFVLVLLWLLTSDLSFCVLLWQAFIF